LEICLFGAGILLPLHSQELSPQERNFFLQTEDGVKIMQRLSWPGDENASQYEVMIEIREQNDWKEVHREITKNTLVEVSLGPGQYRYRVSYYNWLNRVDDTTNWALFNIVSAAAPVISAWDPQERNLQADKRLDITLEGDNFFKETKIWLEPAAGDEGVRIVPSEIIISRGGQRVRLVFNDVDLQTGEYSLHAVNPGGFETVIDPFVLDRASSFNIHVSAAYAPLIPCTAFFLDAFDKPSWQGAMIRAGFPVKWHWDNLSAEASFSWNYFTGSGENVEITTHLVNAQADILYRKPLTRYFTFNARAGIGVAYFPALTFKIRFLEEKINPWYFSVNGGISLFWYFSQSFYAELGADYIVLFTKGFPGFLRPSLSVGWRY
jgi:hypothetical protein